MKTLRTGVTYQVEIDEQTGFQEKVISESRDKKLIPTLDIEDGKEVVLFVHITYLLELT